MKNKKIKILLYLIILFVSIKCKIEYETKIINNEILTIDNLTESQYYYHILFESQSNIPNYLKIISKEKNENSDNYEYALSYYGQDSTFTNRIQLSKLSNSPIIWLNKEQIENGFYFSIECYTNKCNGYYINIYPKNVPELILGQQYSYYVTNENKNMTFSFIRESQLNQTDLNNNKNNTVIVWARGNKKIVSQLEGTKYEKHSIYNAYIIKSEDINEYNFSIIVEGTIGDLINVGGFIFQNNDDYNHYICENCDIFSEFENIGFLKKNIIEENCFEISHYRDDIHIIPIDNNNIEIPISNYWNKTNKYACVRLPNNIDELFFIFQNIYYNEPNKEKKDFIFYNLFLGYNYHQYLKEGINIGYIPTNIEEDFKFLTYNIFIENINNKAYILTCDNYPFCLINEEEISKSTPIKNHLGFYSISFNKDELDIHFSPINKIKKVLIITCNNDINNKDNGLYVNIYTDKTQIIIPSEIPIQYKYIRKENEDNLIIKKNNNIFADKDHTFINVEILSGDISLNSNPSTDKHYEYKKIHLFSLNKNESFSLKIKAKQNSVYSIKYYLINLKNEYINFVPFGGNYLLYIEKISYIILMNSLKSKNKNNQKYISFYPKNKKMEINYNSGNDSLKTYKLPITNKTFYQDIFIEEQDSLHIKTFHLDTNDKNNNNSYLLYMSSYYCENDNNEILESSIILEENIVKTILFNQKYKENKFTYLFSSDEYNKEVNITFNLLNNGNYEINIFINNIELEQKLIITSNKTKKIDYNDWKDICINEQQICKISFNITSNNSEQDSILEIYINKKEEEKDDGENESESDEEEKDTNNKKKKKKNKTVLIVFLVILCVILLIIIFFLKLTCIKMNNKLEEEVTKISFIDSDNKELRDF